jgi:hypothetical protein
MYCTASAFTNPQTGLLTSEPDVFCADAYLRFGVEPDLKRVASKSKANATLSSWCTAVPLLLVSDDT